MSKLATYIIYKAIVWMASLIKLWRNLVNASTNYRPCKPIPW
jgi:hypothetical protein